MHDSSALFQPPTETPGKGLCHQHGEYDTIMIKLPGNHDALPGPCPSCEIAQLDERRKLRAKQRMHELNRLLERAGIPKRFRYKSLDEYVPGNDSQAKALAVAKRYAENFAERYESGGCLVFLGPCGTGKSHLACGIGNRIVADGYSCLFTTVIEAVRLVRSTYGGKSELTEAQAINRFTWPDLLILDEVGMQHGTDNEFLIMTELINLRYAAERPTIMLSNLTPEKFEEFVGDRVFDRLHENGGMVLTVAGPSRRRST